MSVLCYFRVATFCLQPGLEMAEEAEEGLEFGFLFCCYKKSIPIYWDEFVKKKKNPENLKE